MEYNMTLEPAIKCWTAKHKSELLMQIFAGQITVAEASRRYDLLQRDIEQWLEDAKAGMENSLRAKPKDVAEQYEAQLRELREAYGEAMLEIKFIKKLQRHLESTPGSCKDF